MLLCVIIPVSYHLKVFVSGFLSVKSNSMAADETEKMWKDADYHNFGDAQYRTEILVFVD